MSGWNAYLPKDMIRSLYGLSADTTGAVMVYLTDVEKSNEVMITLREAFEKKGYTLQEHDPQPFFMKFETVSGEVLGRAVRYSDAQLSEILSPAHFVGVRITAGGPAPPASSA